MRSISILGCGWLGLPLGSHLAKSGHSVKGSTTSEDKINQLEEEGITPYLLDLSARDYDIFDFLQSEVLVIALPSKQVVDFKYLIEKVEKSRIKKVIFISSTSVYPTTNKVITEASPVNQSVLPEIEQLFLTNTQFECTIIRFGGLIGYNRKPGNFFKNNRSIPNPEGYVNLIHRDDCIRIIDQIIQKNIWGEILNACADSHPNRRAFYTNQFLKEGRGIPPFEQEPANEYKIINSDKLKFMLDFQFEYSDLMDY
jgi:nucleoside-diphosphate-sugar epimerase